MTEKLQGEQFTQHIKFTGAGYDECEQLVVVVYNSSDSRIANTFVKLADEKYPDATLLKKNELDGQVIDLFFEADKTATMIGKYSIEIKRVVSGVGMPIIKHKVNVYNFSTSKTV